MLNTRMALEQCVVVRIAGELFGIDIANVREIIRVPAITRVPNTSVHVRGIMNLRGRIVPVLDTTLLLGATPAESTAASRIVIITTLSGDMGLLADAVLEVLSFDPDVIETLSAVSWTKDDIFDGVLSDNGRLIALLNIDRLVARGSI